MQITATQVFLHGEDRYEEGETYEVAPELAGYFVHNGWATSPEIATPGAPPEESAELEVQDVVSEQDTPEV